LELGQLHAVQAAEKRNTRKDVGRFIHGRSSGSIWNRSQGIGNKIGCGQVDSPLGRLIQFGLVNRLCRMGPSEAHNRHPPSKKNLFLI
jgi:hypothetical protein